MKVTVDTRHDSLEEALATVHAAFGSSTTEPAAAPSWKKRSHRRQASDPPSVQIGNGQGRKTVRGADCKAGAGEEVDEADLEGWQRREGFCFRERR